MMGGLSWKSLIKCGYMCVKAESEKTLFELHVSLVSLLTYPVTLSPLSIREVGAKSESSWGYEAIMSVSQCQPSLSSLFETTGPSESSVPDSVILQTLSNTTLFFSQLCALSP